MTGSNTFPKQERLSGLAEIDRLFKTGNSLAIPPLKVLYAIAADAVPVPVRVLITVPSKKFKRAVDRNRIRRKIREAYRLNRTSLVSKHMQAGSRILLGIIYIGEVVDPDYALLENSLIRCLDRLEKKSFS